VVTSARKPVSHADVAKVVCSYLSALRMIRFDFSQRPDLAPHEARLKSLGAELLRSVLYLPLIAELEVSDDFRRARRRLPGTTDSYVVWEESEPVQWPLLENPSTAGRATVWTPFDGIRA
jgi:hypothetical protein